MRLRWQLQHQLALGDIVVFYPSWSHFLLLGDRSSLWAIVDGYMCDQVEIFILSLTNVFTL